MRYDFICLECEELFEIEKPMGSKKTVLCPVCGTGNVERLIFNMPATVMNWWNAAASSDDGGIHKRFRKASRRQGVKHECGDV